MVDLKLVTILAEAHEADIWVVLLFALHVHSDWAQQVDGVFDLRDFHFAFGILRIVKLWLWKHCSIGIS